jgi:hypothetical protein
MSNEKFEISPQLATIANWNPGITLSDDDVKLANAGTLVLVGVGSILPPLLPPIIGPVIGGGAITKKGCIEYMRYQKGNDDLAQIRIDGASYSGGNLKDFREILEKAAFHMKCINFCWNNRTNQMTMLNVYPQCCCRCEENKT